MPTGTPVSRHCILTLRDGRIVVDWGNDHYQDLSSGEFVTCTEADISYTALDQDLESLRLAGLVASYDAFQVYLYNLPEPPHSALT